MVLPVSARWPNQYDNMTIILQILGTVILAGLYQWMLSYAFIPFMFVMALVDPKEKITGAATGVFGLLTLVLAWGIAIHNCWF